MCGRFGFTAKDKKEVMDRFEIESIKFDLKNSYNIAPTQNILVVQKHSPNTLNIIKWGIKPHWSNSFLINAQSEKLPTSNLWKKAFMENRCLIPARFFYEWKKTDSGKTPYLIKLKSDELFGMAGIIVSYHDENKNEKNGVIIITTTPNNLMRSIHSRMPAILSKENEEDWLNPDNIDEVKLHNMLAPLDESLMESYPVSTRINSPKNNSPDLIKKI